MTAHNSRDAAEHWFLDRELPAVLTARARSRYRVPRAAPALAAYATVVLALLGVYFLTGSSEIYIDGAPTPAEQIVLTVIALTISLAVRDLLRPGPDRAQPDFAGEMDRRRRQ